MVDSYLQCASLGTTPRLFSGIDEYCDGKGVVRLSWIQFKFRGRMHRGAELPYTLACKSSSKKNGPVQYSVYLPIKSATQSSRNNEVAFLEEMLLGRTTNAHVEVEQKANANTMIPRAVSIFSIINTILKML